MNKSSLGVFGALAQALISLFRMLTKGFSVVENAVDMAAQSVDVAAEEQAIEITLKKERMLKQLVDGAALKTAQDEEVMAQYGQKSPEHKRMLDEIRKNLNDKVSQALLQRKHS